LAEHLVRSDGLAIINLPVGSDGGIKLVIDLIEPLPPTEDRSLSGNQPG